MAVQGTSYANWLNQNDGALLQSAGYQQPPVAAPAVVQQPAAPDPYQRFDAPATGQTTGSSGANVWNQLSGMIGQGGQQQQPAQLRPSAFTTQVQPDAPNVQKVGHDPGYKGFIKRVVGAIATYGASEAAQQKPQERGG